MMQPWNPVPDIPLDRRGLLIVSLPRNDLDLARAAMTGGADLLKLHVNVHHRASGTIFGSVREELDRLEAILDLGTPTGLVPGEEKMVSREELPLLRRFAFLDAYITHLPLYLYGAGVPVVPAVPHDFPLEVLSFLRSLPGGWVEAALVASDEYGRPPQTDDFPALARVGDVTGRRLIVPTQRRIHPDDLGRYFDIPAVGAIMIGAVVTGLDPTGVESTTRAFRRSLSRLFA